jgi:uncharacterized protein YndB with AHSA1/START domain
MVDIIHRVGVKGSSPKVVFDALTSLDGLSNWWARDTTGSTALGGVLKFRFAVGGFDMKVLAAEPGARLQWEVIDGPEEWIGTLVNWELTRQDDFTIVLFSHRGWREEVEFMNHCSTKWAIYLMSLKALLETGVGQPDPDDVQISDWH